MVRDRSNRPFWLRCVAAVFLTIFAAFIRWQFLGVLGLRAAFITFFPAVALAALYGGFAAGLLASALSAILADYFWAEPVGRFAAKSIPDLIGIFLFLAAGVLISWLAEAAFRAQVRADRAEGHARLLAERERAEENAARLAAILEFSNDAIIGKTLEGKIVSWNRAAETIFGYGAEEILAQPVSMLFPAEGVPQVPEILEKIRRAEVVENLEAVCRKKSGELLDVSLSIYPIRDSSGNIAAASTIVRDISGQKRIGRERDVTIELLKIINDNPGTADLARAAAAFFREQSGCEAVAIRLKQGEDFPYAETLGFPEEFVRRENSLCTRDSSGKVVRDDSGYPSLECMCGRVILELIDPSSPFFSAGGSFWTNCTTGLLASAPDARHQCNAAGYESVALIPLNIGSERFGILQLNDRREGMFSPELIAQWERLAGYLAVALARSRSEETMRESEERFRVLADSIPQLAWIANPDGSFVWYNRRWYEYTGATPEQVAGWGWRRLHDPLVLPEVIARWKESLATGTPFDMVFPLRGADGNFRQFLTRVEPVRDVNGNVVQWCGTNTDITERRRMEEEIRKSRDELDARVQERTAELERANQVVQTERKRLFDVLETLPAMISLLTSDYHVAFANRSFREKFGLSQGRRCYEYRYGNSEPCDFCQTFTVLETGAPHHWEITAPDGGVIDAWDFPFTDVDGAPMILEMDIDITDRRRAEAELNATMEKLRQSNQALQDFASIASHDLQEPLRKVVSFGGMLKKNSEAALGETGNDYLDRMLAATRRMQSLLTGLLEYSRVTTQANPFTRTDLNEIVGEVLSDLEIRIERVGAEVRTANLPIVKADPVQMRQVFQNLIGNGLKFYREEKQPLIEIEAVRDGGKLEIIVKDNGIGFENRYVEKIFAPFQRLHGKEGPYAGTGMGLAICKKIVERHGWRITAESVPGEGSKFIIGLPPDACE